jgi:hypothetical protein
MSAASSMLRCRVAGLRERSRSIDRLRAMATSHEIGLARLGSNAPARCQTVM